MIKLTVNVFMKLKTDYTLLKRVYEGKCINYARFLASSLKHVMFLF